jgi:hypothetical protein
MKKFLIFAVVFSVLSSASSFASSELFITPNGDANPIAITKKSMKLVDDEVVFTAPDGRKEVLHTNQPMAEAIYKKLLSKDGNYKVWSKPAKEDGSDDSVDWVVQELDDRGAILSTMMIWEFAAQALESERAPASLRVEKK